MEKGFESGAQLRDFVEKHKLRNSQSITQFNSFVSIKTAKNNIWKHQIVVMIRFDDSNSYGRLVFIEHDLDPKLYPTDFDANYQQIKHVDDQYLLITGNHTANVDIGKYEVKITPLNKLTE